MSIIDPVKKWLYGIAIKKAVLSAAKLIVSYAIAHGIRINVAIGGVAIDSTSEAAMVVALNSSLTFVRNWAKVKWPKQLGWL